MAHPTSGSFGAWAEFYVGPLAGFLVRYAYWSSIALAVGMEVTAIAVYMRYWYPHVPGWLWIVLFSAALISINAVSVRLFGSVEYCFSLLKIAAILAFIVLGGWLVFTRIGFGNYTSHRWIPAQRRMGYVGRGARMYFQLLRHRDDRRSGGRGP